MVPAVLIARLLVDTWITILYFLEIICVVLVVQDGSCGSNCPSAGGHLDFNRVHTSSQRISQALLG
jgi:hypothetical protein